MMTEPEMEARLALLNEEARELARKLKPLVARQCAVIGEAGKLRDQLSELHIARIRMATPDWPSLIKDMAGGPRHTGAMIQYTNDLLAEMGLTRFGHWADTKEACISLKVLPSHHVNAGWRIAQTIHAVHLFTPLFTPHPDGHVWFQVTTEGMDEYRLLVLPDFSRFELVSTSYGHQTSYGITNSIITMIPILQEHCPYGY